MLYTHPQTIVTLTEADIRAAHPHTSWPVPITAADVAAFGYEPVQPTPQPDYDPCTHTCTPAAPVPAPPGAAVPWLQAWQLTSRPEAEAAQLLAEHAASQAAAVRLQRDRLLAACDWTQLPDVQANHSPALRAAWLSYRQSLRSVPEQPGFPADITWPNLPNSGA